MTIRLNQVYGALAPLTEGNFQFGLNYGSGLGVSSGQLVNTGVLSLQGDTGSLSLGAGTGIGISGLTISNTGIISASAGNGISVSGTNPLTITNTGIISASAGNGISVSGTNPLTITNTGVLSLQGDTGALSLSAGTGIGISGLTISNTGIISASAGNGISVSGTNPLTITNTGVLSLQGDTGTLSLSAGTGIGISGLTISNTGIISASAGSGISVSGTNPLTITNTGVLSLSSNGSLNVSPLFFVPFTITNSTSTDTPAPFQQMVVVNPSLYTSYLSSNLSNVQWLDASGNIINSWLESGNSNTGTKAVYWLKLPNGIGANSSITVYMGIASTTINMLNNTTTGEAPQLSAIYGQYDNGANVFPILYQNFQGTSVPSGWVSAGTVTINNGVTVSFRGYLTTGATYGLNANQILDAGFITPTANAGDAWYQIGYVSQSGGYTYSPSTAIAWNTNDAPPYFVTEGSSSWTGTQFPSGVGNAGTFNVGTIYWGSSSSDSGMINYANTITFTTPIPSSALYVGINNNQRNGTAPPVATLYWIRLRAYPPNGAMPAISVGSLSTNTGGVTIFLNTANPNSWSATQTIGALTVDDAVGGTPFTPNGNTAFAFYNGGSSNYVGSGEWLGFWRDNGNYFAPLIGEQNGAFIIAFANDSATAYNGLNANRGTMAFQVEPSGAVYTGINQNYLIPTTGSNSIAIRNVLDDGSGNMSIGGSFSSSGNMTVGGNFTVNEDINVGGILTVSDNVTIGGTLTVDSLTNLQYYHSTTFTALYTTTNTSGVSGSFALSFYTTLTNSMHVNISASTISVFSIFGEHNDGGSTGVGVLLTSVSYSAETNIPYDSSDIIAYFPAISTAGNTSDSSSTQTWIASGVASTNGSCYITIVCEQSYASHILEFNQTVITFP